MFRVVCTNAYPTTVVLIYRGVDLTGGLQISCLSVAAVLALDVATETDRDVSVGVRRPEAPSSEQPIRNLTTIPTFESRQLALHLACMQLRITKRIFTVD